MLRHQPVMAKEVLESMPSGRKVYVDGTFGHGGHVEYIMDHVMKSEGVEAARQKRIVAIDRDQRMLNKGKELLERFHAHIDFVHDSYSNIEHIMHHEMLPQADYILLDLGVNMEHFKDGERGFSFHTDAPLDMRFDQTN